MPFNTIRLIPFHQIQHVDEKQVKQLNSVWAARQFIKRYQNDVFAMNRFRSALLSFRSTPVHRMGDDEVIERLALEVARRNILVVTEQKDFSSARPLRNIQGGTSAKEETKQPTVRTPTRKYIDEGSDFIVNKSAASLQWNTDWVKLRAVEDETNMPINGIKLELTLSDQTKKQVNLGSDGSKTIIQIASGPLDAACDLQQAYIGQSFIFSKTGSSASGSQGDSPDIPGNTENKSGHLGSDQSWIVGIQEARVKDGDTLESIAQAFNMTWQELAYFNWKTTDTEKLSSILVHELGCTPAETSDSLPELSSADKPATLFIPEKWSETGLSTEEEHIFRLKKPPLTLRFQFQVRDDEEGAQDDTIILETTDNKWKHTVLLKDMPQIDGHWRDMAFPMPPAGTKLNLIQQPATGKHALVIFEKMPLEDVIAWAAE